MPPSIRRATTADSTLVPRILARAFDDDPWVNFLARQDSRRAARILWSFERVFVRSLEVGEGWVAEDRSGAALWFPFDEPYIEGWRGRLARLRGGWNMLRGLAPLSGVDRAFTAYRARGRVTAAHPTAPHMELRLLGVEPDRRGEGVASALLCPVLDRMDAEGCLTALTCTKQRNIPLYEHFGFAVTSEIRISSDVCVWVMQRPPRVTS